LALPVQANQEVLMQTICECGNHVVLQGYCDKCLREYEIQIDNEYKLEQFERFALAPQTTEELETERKITESLQEPVNGHKSTKHNQPGGHPMNSTLTDVTTYPYNDANKPNLKAFATITLNGDFVVKGIRLMNGKNGLFCGFPENYKSDTKQNFGICFPITASLRDKITKAIISKYNGEEVTFATAEEPAEASV
jgi:stage V sporulation protein G